MTEAVARIIEQLLDRPISYHRRLAQLFDSVNAAIVLGQAIYWSKRTSDPEKWFYKTTADWKDETYLSKHELKSARVALGSVLEVKLKGVPATCHYRVNYEELAARLPEIGNLVGELTESLSAGIRKSLNTEITAETTSIRDKKKKKAKQTTLFSIASESLPPPLNTPEMQDAWDRWQEHCRQHGNKLTELAARAQIKRMREWALATGVERAIAAIDYSIEQNWKSIYEKKAGRDDSAARPKEDYAKLNKQTAL